MARVDSYGSRQSSRGDGRANGLRLVWLPTMDKLATWGIIGLPAVRDATPAGLALVAARRLLLGFAPRVRRSRGYA